MTPQQIVEELVKHIAELKAKTKLLEERVEGLEVFKEATIKLVDNLEKDLLSMVGK